MYILVTFETQQTFQQTNHLPNNCNFMSLATRTWRSLKTLGKCNLIFHSIIILRDPFIIKLFLPNKCTTTNCLIIYFLGKILSVRYHKLNFCKLLYHIKLNSFSKNKWLSLKDYWGRYRRKSEHNGAKLFLKIHF